MPTILRTGSFPHQAYVARCGCLDGHEEPTLNYARHKVAPPKCSACKRPYQLDERIAEPHVIVPAPLFAPGFVLHTSKGPNQ
jgi:hypothetical protein